MLNGNNFVGALEVLMNTEDETLKAKQNGMRDVIFTKEDNFFNGVQTLFKQQVADDLRLMRDAAQSLGMGTAISGPAKSTSQRLKQAFDEGKAMNQILTQKIQRGEEAQVHRFLLERNAGSSAAVVPFMFQHILLDVAYQRESDMTVGTGAAFQDLIRKPGEPDVHKEQRTKLGELELKEWGSWKQKILYAEHFTLQEKQAILGRIDDQIEKITGAPPSPTELYAEPFDAPTGARPFDLWSEVDTTSRQRMAVPFLGTEPVPGEVSLTGDTAGDYLHPIKTAATTSQKNNLITFIRDHISLAQSGRTVDDQQILRQIVSKQQQGLLPRSTDSMKVLEEIMALASSTKSKKDASTRPPEEKYLDPYDELLRAGTARGGM